MPEQYSFQYSATGVGNSHVYTLPDPVPEAGMLLLVTTVGASQVGSDSISGFTKIATATNGGGERIAFYKGIAVGGGADVITATGGGFIAREGYVICVANWDGVLGNVGYVATTTNSLNPPSLGMGAVRQHLWYAFARADNVISAGPSGFGGFHHTRTSNRSHAFASLLSNVATLDPGAFTATTSAAIAATIGIRPGTSGPPPSPGRPGFMSFFMNHHRDELAARRAQREWKQRESGIYCRDSGLVAA